MLYVSNAFSLSMLDREGPAFTPQAITLQGAKELVRAAEWESAVGHENTAALFAKVLDWGVPANRVSIRLGENDQLLVGQYVGPRLEEGATSLPEGARIDWWLVEKAFW
jgi:hypothetical protein